MKTKQMILHQLKCEWLSFRWLVGLWVIFLGWACWMFFSWDAPLIDYRSRGNIRYSVELAYVFIGCFVFIFALCVYKRDDYREVCSAWQTRPVR